MFLVFAGACGLNCAMINSQMGAVMGTFKGYSLEISRPLSDWVMIIEAGDKFDGKGKVGHTTPSTEGKCKGSVGLGSVGA